MLRTQQPPGRINAFEYCGAHAYVLKSADDPPQFKIAGSTCHDRFCLPCGQRRSRQIARNVIDHAVGRRLRFVTLTTGKQAESLGDLIDHLYTSFRALQRRRFWRKHATGGVAFLELKRSSRSNRWHPHLHIIVEGKYMPHDQLRAEWCTVTEGDRIVHIRGNINSDAIMHYVTKYASKPMDRSYLNVPEYLDEAILALKSRRLCVTWGGWRKVLLTKTDDEAGWQNIGELSAYLLAAEAGDLDALAVCRAVSGSATQSTIGEPRPPPPADGVQSVPYTGTQLRLFETRVLCY